MYPPDCLVVILKALRNTAYLFNIEVWFSRHDQMAVSPRRSLFVLEKDSHNDNFIHAY